MEKSDYELLEKLFMKLQSELDGDRCALIGATHDGFSIGRYNSAGNLIKQATSSTIQNAVEILNNKTNEKQIKDHK